MISNGNLLSCSWDKKVKLWQTETGKELILIEFNHRVNDFKLLNGDLTACQLKLRISDIHLEELDEIYSKMRAHLKKTQLETKKFKNDLLLGEAISFEKHEKNSYF